MAKASLILPSDYSDWLINLKKRINDARQRAVFAVNQEQIQLYHNIGKDILERQTRGAGVLK